MCMFGRRVLPWLRPQFVRTALLVAGVASAQLVAGQVTVEWVAPTRGVSVAVDVAHNVFTLDFEQALGSEMTVTKRDVNGQLLWVSSSDQTDSTKWERGAWLTTDSAGNAIACGTLMSGFSNPVEAASVVVKFAPNGQVIWRRVYESSFDGSAVRRCLVDDEDNVYVLGKGTSAFGVRTKIKAFDPEGNVIWTWFDPVGIGLPIHFKFTPDHQFVVTARAPFGSLNGYAKVSLDGQTVWTLAGVQSLTVGDVAGDSSGNSYVVHGEYVADGGTVVRKLDPAGQQLWSQVFGLSAFRVEVGPDDQPIVAGFPDTGSGGAAFQKVSPSGASVWSNLDADGPLALLLHAQLLVDASGDAYLAAGTLFEMAVCKVGSDGDSRWTQLVAGSYANALALNAHDDSLFVVGGTTARLSDPAEGPWHDLGAALPGSGGVAPYLHGQGSLEVGSPVGLALFDALPAAAVWIVLGTAPLHAPFKGGLLVPVPELVVGGLMTDAQGNAQTSPATWPAVGSGLELFAQAWIVDGGAPVGFAATNGLRGRAP